MYINLVASTFSSISIFSHLIYIIYIYIYLCSYKVHKIILLGKGMVVKIIFQCTSFHNVMGRFKQNTCIDLQVNIGIISSLKLRLYI